MTIIQDTNANQALAATSALPLGLKETPYTSNNSRLQIAKECCQLPYQYRQPYAAQSVSEQSALAAITQIVAQFTAVLQKALLMIEEAIKIALDSKAASNTPEDNTTVQEEAPVENTSGTPPASPTSTGKTSTLAKSGEFLWKPVSEKDKKLAILIPSKLSKTAKAVRILDPNGKLLAKGTYSGIGNGNRAHFRFNKAGSAFPDKAIVEIVQNNGNIKRVRIPETSQRFVK